MRYPCGGHYLEVSLHDDTGQFYIGVLWLTIITPVRIGGDYSETKSPRIPVSVRAMESILDSYREHVGSRKA